MGDLQELLRDHSPDGPGYDAGDIQGCTCGKDFADAYGKSLEAAWDAYYAHVEAVVFDWIREGARMPVDVDRLRAIGKAATDEPWTTSPSKYVPGAYVHQDRPNGRQVRHAVDTSAADAEFIATARNEWAAMLGDIESLRGKVARVESLVEAAEVADQASLMRTFDGGTFGARVRASDLRTALADGNDNEGGKA